MYIVTEFMVNGALRDYLMNHKKEIPFKTMIDMAAQVSNQATGYVKKASHKGATSNGRCFASPK